MIIGDSLTSDIKGGNAAGIDTIWFNKNKLPEIPEIKPTYRVNSLAELYPLLEKTYINFQKNIAFSCFFAIID